MLNRLLPTIKSRVIFALAIYALSTITIGLYSAFSATQMRTGVSRINVQNTQQMGRLSKLTIAILNSRTTLRRLQATRLPADVEVFAPVIRKDLDAAEQQWAAYYASYVRDDRDRQFIDKLGLLIAGNRRYANEALAAYVVGNFDAGADAVNRGAAVAAELTSVLKETVDLDLRIASQASDESTSSASRISRISFGLVVFNLLIAIVVSVATLRSILIPLKNAINVANNIASGKLENQFTVESCDEVAQLLAAMKEMEQQLQRMIYQDPLTTLPNRTFFNERLKQMIASSAHGALAGVMMVDLDQFKRVNDTMGHAAGDELLNAAAGRLSACIRSNDIVARFSGDEFAILLPGVPDLQTLEEIARRIIASFDKRFVLNGTEIYVTCSVGIALYPIDSAEPVDLLKYVDSAMYCAKRAGRRRFSFYSKELTETARKRFTIERELRRATERGEFELHYQPKISIRQNEVTGSEALLRWRRSDGTLVAPNEFISVAEETGLIVEIGKWVLHEACSTAVAWNTGRVVPHKVAINLSVRQFQSSDLVSVVTGILEKTGCRPAWLEFEITESLLLDSNDAILAAISTFRSMGISIAIDDFGTGYSSLSYLTRFPVDTLKIDKSFVQKATTARHHAELVKAIISIGQCLGMQTVAEGVETEEQAAFLASSGCEIAQGFLYCKPLSRLDMSRLPPQLAPSPSQSAIV